MNRLDLILSLIQLKNTQLHGIKQNKHRYGFKRVFTYKLSVLN